MAEDVPWYMRRRTCGAETFHLIIYIFIDFSILYFPVRGLVLSSWRITLLAMEEMVSWLFELLLIRSKIGITLSYHDEFLFTLKLEPFHYKYQSIFLNNVRKFKFVILFTSCVKKYKKYSTMFDNISKFEGRLFKQSLAIF